MNIKQAQYIQTIANEGSITAAAKKNIYQSAISEPDGAPGRERTRSNSV